MTLAGLRRLAPGAIVTLFAVRYAPGADQAAAYASLRRDFGPVVLRHVAAQDVENVARVAALPTLLAALMAVLAIAALAQALVTGVRRGRKDVAIRSACGFVPRQIAATVVWQAGLLAVCGLALGIPLGIIVGRSAWNIVAEQIGTSASPLRPRAPSSPSSPSRSSSRPPPHRFRPGWPHAARRRPHSDTNDAPLTCADQDGPWSRPVGGSSPAEREGFEPPGREASRFQGGCICPLCHRSVSERYRPLAAASLRPEAAVATAPARCR